MTEFAAAWIGLLADWSLRWGAIILALLALFLVCRPRAVAVRLWLARLVLIGGLLLPFSPHWWTIPRVQPTSAAAPITSAPATRSGVQYFPPTTRSSATPVTTAEVPTTVY